jgi:uncharacterized protein YrzB (UPF0473 family)
VLLTNESHSSTNHVLQKFGGQNNKEYLLFGVYSSWFRSSSNNCPIETYELLTTSPLNGSLVAYSDLQITKDVNKNFVIRTEKSFHLNLILMVNTKNGTAFAMPFNVSVLEPQFDLNMNMPPFLSSPPASIFSVVDPLDPILTYTFNVSEPLDDHNKLEKIKFSSKSLGKLGYVYDHEGQATKVEQMSSYLEFKPETNFLSVRFTDIDDITKTMQEAAEITITLTDKQGLSKEYRVTLTLKVLERTQEQV